MVASTHYSAFTKFICKIVCKHLLKTMKKVAVYARSAVKDGKAIKSQLARIIKTFNLSKFIKFTDNGKSGLDSNRPGLKKLLRGAKRGNFDTLYVADVSRLSRNSSQLSEIIKELEKKVKIVFCQKPFQYYKCKSKC